jgi:DNA-binding transcriptional ArsR family regulator
MGNREQTEHRERQFEQTDFVTAINHPLRVELLAILATREASPSELAKELGEELGVVNYHARKLEGLGMLEIVRERPVRGSTEHFYKASTRPWWTSDQWARVDPKMKSTTTVYVLDWLFQDAGAALSAGTFDRRDDRHLSRTPLVLDEEGWKAVSSLLDDTLDALLHHQSQATQRMAGSGEKPVRTLVGLMSFETLAPPDTAESGPDDASAT